MKIQEAIDRICKWHEPFVEHENGRDKVLCGNTDQECTGIGVTVCATYDVIRKAVEQNINFIITHESIFFGGRIDTDGLEENAVYQEKRRLIEENNIVIWRDHDRLHGNGRPFHPERKRNDYIFYGICQELGWEDYIVDDPMKPTLYKIPQMSAGAFADLLMDRFGLEGLRIVGDLETPVSIVWFSEHTMGNKNDGVAVRKAQSADAIIPFEICDYTLTQYVRDAAAMGKKKVLLEMGHFNCEELGMQHCLKWLPEALGTDVSIRFLKAGDQFGYVTR